MRFSSFASSSARVGRRRFRRLALPLGLAPLLAIVLALLAGGGLPEPPPGAIPAIPGADAPAAEAVGRPYDTSHDPHLRKPYGLNASDVSDEALMAGSLAGYDGTAPMWGGDPNPGRCVIDINPPASQDNGEVHDLFCVSYTERALVTFTASGASVPYRAYVSGGRAGMGDAYHAGVQIVGEHARDGSDINLGRAGLAEYNGVLEQNESRTITLDRSMATPHRYGGADYYPAGHGGSLYDGNAGAAYIVIYPGEDNGALGTVASKIEGNGLADAMVNEHPIVRLYFILDYAPELTWLMFHGVYEDDEGRRIPVPWADVWRHSGPTPTLRTGDHYIPQLFDTPNDRFLTNTRYREYDLTGYYVTEEDIRDADPGEAWRWRYFHRRPEALVRSDGNGPGENNNGVIWCLRPKDYADGAYWHPGAYAEARVEFSLGTNRTSSGDYTALPRTGVYNFRGECVWQYLDGFDPAGPMRGQLTITYHDGKGGTFPFEPITLLVQGPPSGILVTGRPEMSVNSGDARSVRIGYIVTDAAGNTLSDNDITGTPTRISYVGADDASVAVIDRPNGAGTAGGGALNIPIKDDAPAGTYRVKLSSASNARVVRTVAFTIYDAPQPRVSPPPAAISAAASGGLYLGGRVNIRYTLADSGGNRLSLSLNPVTWAAADDATQAVIDTDGRVDGARQSDGAFGFDLADDAAPGDYAIVVSTVATDAGVPLASVRVPFRILGDPASYAIAGADRVAPGGYAIYTVTAADGNGNRPFLGGERSRVTVTVAGTAASSVRLFNITDSAITLNREGSGRFRLRVNAGAAAGSVTITVASPDSAATAVTAEKVVTIGPAP